jgi:hypothetical protein
MSILNGGYIGGSSVPHRGPSVTVHGAAETSSGYAVCAWGGQRERRGSKERRSAI